MRRTTGQFGLFLVFGATQLGADWLAFVLLTWAGIGVAIANLAGRVLGAALGYFLNGRYTFPKAQGGERGRLVRFVVGWAATSLVSTLTVVAVEQELGLKAAWIGKLFVDGAIAVMAFLLSKHWIFK